MRHNSAFNSSLPPSVKPTIALRDYSSSSSSSSSKRKRKHKHKRKHKRKRNNMRSLQGRQAAQYLHL